MAQSTDEFFGIRSLNQIINEWVFRSVSADTQELVLEPEYMIVGNISVEKSEKEKMSLLKRLPWESFGKVGFRCAKDVSGKYTPIKKPSGYISNSWFVSIVEDYVGREGEKLGKSRPEVEWVKTPGNKK